MSFTFLNNQKDLSATKGHSITVQYCARLRHHRLQYSARYSAGPGRHLSYLPSPHMMTSDPWSHIGIRANNHQPGHTCDNILSDISENIHLPGPGVSAWSPLTHDGLRLSCYTVTRRLWQAPHHGKLVYKHNMKCN